MNPDVVTILASLVPFDPIARRPHELPVLLIEAPRGSGKSDLLTSVDKKWSGEAPTARVDLKRVPDTVRPHRIAVALAYYLGRRRLRPDVFSRLSLGLTCLATDLPVGSVGEAEAELQRVIRNRDRAVSVVKTMTERADKALDHAPGILGTGFASAAAALVLQALPAATWYFRQRRGAYEWYRDQLGTADPWGALVELSQLDRAGRTAEVDELLVGAFLADLRAGYEARWLPHGLDRRVLVLIDDVDWPRATGTAPTHLRFLDVVLSRRDKDREAGLTADPVVVVATSATRSGGEDGGPAISGFPFRRAVVRTTDDVATYPRPVYNPGVPAAIHILDASGSGLRPSYVADPVDRMRYAVAGGHRAALDSLVRPSDDQIVQNCVHLEAMLPRAAFPELVTALIEPESHQVSPDLLAWSAECPTDRDAGAGLQTILRRLQHRSHEQAFDQREIVERFVTRRLWDPENPSRMLPWFRTVLLTELSRVADDEATTWERVFHVLVAASGDIGGRREHYQLALEGRVSSAVRFLGEELRQNADPEQWVALFGHITRAPRRRDFHPDELYPDRLHEALSGADGPRDPEEEHLARALAARWLSVNAVGEPDQGEYLHIASAFSSLAEVPGRTVAMQNVLFKLAQAYRRAHDERRFPFDPFPEVLT